MQQTIPVNDGFISSHVGTTPSTGPFAVDFPFFSLNDVVVTRQADGSVLVEALVRGADYDITGVATDDGSFSSGSVTLYVAVSNTTVVRFRTTPVERLSNFPLQGFFSRLSLNAELNKITVYLQELNALLGSTSEASQAHAPLVSPTLLGNPRGPTPAPGDNDTSLATTAFVTNALAGTGSLLPPGIILDFAGATAPSGWLICNAQVVSRTVYAGLFGAIGTTYNLGGEASTDFRLPDLRGRVTAGLDSGGSNRLNAAIPASGTIGAAGGEQAHQLIVSEMPSHSHVLSINAPGSAFLASAGTSGTVSWTGGNTIAAVGATAGLTGGNGGHNVTQPTMMLQKIIKT